VTFSVNPKPLPPAGYVNFSMMIVCAAAVTAKPNAAIEATFPDLEGPPPVLRCGEAGQ
jgi:hypothetical protein